MSATQIENMIAQNSKGLSIEILQQVLEFIQFLKLKKDGFITDSLQSGLSEFNASENRHLDEEFLDYTTIYPKE